MAIRCYANCRFNNGGWCDLDYLEVDEKAVCAFWEEGDEVQAR